VRFLENDRLLMVFPEGARGTGKLFKDRYQLVRFGTGFMRIALQTRSPIVPFAFIGGEEALPTIYHAKALAKLVGSPYVPIPPYLLPVPMPLPCELHYSEPMHFEGDGTESDEIIEGYVSQVRQRIESLIEKGREMHAREGWREHDEGRHHRHHRRARPHGRQRLVSHGHEVLGSIAARGRTPPRGVTMFRADIRKRPAEDVFRTQSRRRAGAHGHRDALLASREERYRTNLVGTRSILEHCHTYGVKSVVFVGRHTVYGAASDTPLYRTEAEPPLAVSTFPDLSDLVAADLFAGSALWRWPELNTSVLRVVYTLGPSQRGTLHNFLRGPRVASVMGFDPLYHFMHEYDAAAAIVLALEKNLRGCYNVAGPRPVPLSVLCEVDGAQAGPHPRAAVSRSSPGASVSRRCPRVPSITSSIPS
jgi:UDP-glucose 4-epimerase